MKKIFYIIVAVLLIVCTFASCKKNNAGPSYEPDSSLYTTENNSVQQSNTVSQTDSTAVIPTESKAPLKTEPQGDKVVTYISENSDNHYICRVAEQYGSDKANLIAFIKKNSSTPGATVLEFSGKRDSNGNLIVTADELMYVYDVSDGKSINRASKDGKNNDGYNKVTAKVAFALGEKFLIPSIDQMRAERRYEDYFAD